MKRSYSLIVIICMLALPLCDSGTDPPQDDAIKAADLRLVNEVPGWSEDANSYIEFKTYAELYSLIDGGADIHIDNGLVEGIFQSMIGISSRSDTFYAEVYAEDFGTAANAQSIYNAIVANDMVDTIHIDGYDKSVAIGSTALGGGGVYAHFGKFYFWLNFTGYSNSDDIAEDAVKYLDIYQSKIGG